jgi:hypothetical protein
MICVWYLQTEDDPLNAYRNTCGLLYDGKLQDLGDEKTHVVGRICLVLATRL